MIAWLTSKSNLISFSGTHDFGENTKPEMVNVLCSNLARTFFIQKGNIPFQKIVDL